MDKDTLNGRAWIEHKNSNKEIKEKVIDINFLQNKVPIKDCLNPKTSHILFSDLIEVWHELNLKKEISFHDLVDAFKDVVRVDYDVMCSHSK